jgi:hypothetical protein
MDFLPFPAPSIGLQVVCSFLINCAVFPFAAGSELWDGRYMCICGLIILSIIDSLNVWEYRCVV